ncbi:MAG: SDR family oxidoreductase [Alphaproteobacteria bacterium]|nr:SDR family oxidoreductase [Alphaproteobacteria bacterium]
MTLTGKIALVTGAGSNGIGRAAARALAAAGADVAIHHLGQAAAAEALALELRAIGRRACVLEADFGDPAAARDVVVAAAAALGPIDILVCTAAVLLRKPALDITDAEWLRVHTVNLHASFALVQEAARGMVPRGGGRIVLISSVNQWTPNPGLAAYAASKAGLMQMARGLALELAPHGVTVNLVAPGTIETDLNRAALADPVWRAAKLDLIPMRRIGTPEDIAAAVLFLAGEGARYITGSTITVDGGLELRP